MSDNPLKRLGAFLSPIPPAGPPVPGTVQPIPPTVEQYANVRLPSGGTQVHGVDPENIQNHDPSGYEVHNYDGIVLDPPPHRDDPVLVQVVRDESADAPEIKNWRSINTTANSGQANRIVSTDRSRTKCLVRNAGPDTLFVGPTESVSPFNGYPVLANTSVDFSHTEDVWAITTSTDPTVITNVYILTEYTINK